MKQDENVECAGNKKNFMLRRETGGCQVAKTEREEIWDDEGMFLF